MLVFLLFGGLLTLCSPPPLSPLAGRIPPTLTALPSETPSPTATPVPSGTPSPTVSPTPPLPTSTPTAPACWTEGGRLEEESLSTPLLTLPMEVLVYLPPCYDQMPERAYPVLYLLHGQNYTEKQWVRLGVPETADALMGSGAIPPYIIVMPHDRLWKDPPETNFDEAFLEVLIPWVERTYRVLPERKYRAVGGLSRGGAWAIHFGFSRWELFGAVGGHSAPVFWSDTPYLDDWLEAIPRESLPRIYLDIGDKDYLRDSNDWLEARLVEHDIPHEWHLYSGYHEEAYWQAHVEEYLGWYGDNWK